MSVHINHYLLAEGILQSQRALLVKTTEIAPDGTISKSESRWDGYRPPPWVDRIVRVYGPAGQETREVLWTRDRVKVVV
jgi:hypothetical protein